VARQLNERSRETLGFETRAERDLMLVLHRPIELTVISGHRGPSVRCPLYPRKRTPLSTAEGSRECALCCSVSRASRVRKAARRPFALPGPSAALLLPTAPAAVPRGTDSTKKLRRNRTRSGFRNDARTTVCSAAERPNLHEASLFRGAIECTSSARFRLAPESGRPSAGLHYRGRPSNVPVAV
jgi:hypothetical protein